MEKLFLITLACLIWQSAARSQDIKPEEVKNIMIKVAEWQIEHYRDTY